NFTYDPIIDTKQSGSTINAAAWTALDVKPLSWLQTTAGVRVDDFRHNHAVVVQPRINSRITLAPNVAILAATGLYSRPPERQDHPINDWRKFDTDQTHNLIALGSYKPNKRWQLGARFQYTSGTPSTPVVGAVFESDRNSYTPTYGATNSDRNRSQNQLDLR